MKRAIGELLRFVLRGLFHSFTLREVEASWLFQWPPTFSQVGSFDHLAFVLVQTAKQKSPVLHSLNLRRMMLRIHIEGCKGLHWGKWFFSFFGHMKRTLEIISSNFSNGFWDSCLHCCLMMTNDSLKRLCSWRDRRWSERRRKRKTCINCLLSIFHSDCG